MEVFEAIPKQWGNSIGVTIPKDIVKKEKISVKDKAKFIVIGASDMKQLKKSFGTLELKKPTQRIMDEIDEVYD